jgi:signal transduction histidine kinase
MPDHDGEQPRGIFVMVTDVTELKEAQLKLEELNEVLEQRTGDAEQANRAKSRFLATVAHEFRTPLSLLTSSTDILDRYGERLSMAEHVQQREHIRTAARRMAELIDSVLTFNRLEAQSPLSVPLEADIGLFCRSLADEIEAACGAGHAFKAGIAADCGTARLDVQLLRRVLENLLTNAFRYTPAGGTVSFLAGREYDCLVVTIADSGIGIPEEDQKLIFEAFYRCRNVEARHGLGLGLAIVREALEQLGGNISVVSRLGEGTAMTVQIPLAARQETEE